METIAKLLMAGALTATLVVVALIVVCEIIDMTRRMEDPIGDIGDETESDQQKGATR